MLDAQLCLRPVLTLQGFVGAIMFDHPSGSTIGAVSAGGESASPDHACRLVRAAVDVAALTDVGTPDRVEEIVVTADDGYHLVHLLAGLGGRLALYVRLDRALGNLALAQRTMRSVGRLTGA